jgi:acyl carrier protein
MHTDELRTAVVETLHGIAPEADLGVLDSTKSFHDQIDIDSVDYLNFMLSLEKRLNVRIVEVDYPQLSTLAGCLAYLAPLVREKTEAG